MDSTIYFLKRLVVDYCRLPQIKADRSQRLCTDILSNIGVSNIVIDSCSLYLCVLCRWMHRRIIITHFEKFPRTLQKSVLAAARISLSAALNYVRI